MTRVLLFWHDSKHYSTLSFLYGMTGELQMKAQAKPVLHSSWLGEWKSIQTKGYIFTHQESLYMLMD